MLARSSSEHAVDIVKRAQARFDELELGRLPDRLRRNNRDYYYLSVWPGLRQLALLSEREAPAPPPLRSGYMHFPFCSGLCDFCSYFVAVSRDPAHDARLARHVDHLLLEVDLYRERTDVELSYLYVGGGTPSLLAPAELERLLGGLRSRGALAARPLGTVELHPEFFAQADRAAAFLGVLADHGIGRVSVGFQSADEGLLEATNRRHGVAFLEDAVDSLHERGFLVNLDLMYGLPAQSLESWVDSINTALALGPDSLSTYFTFVDPYTQLWRDVESGVVTLPSHELIQTQHIAAQLVLEEAGHLELPGDFWSIPEDDPSAFTQTELPSARDSVGFGAGAYGYHSGMQYFNQFSLTSYGELLADRRLPLWRGALLDSDQLLRRDVMFSLKNSPCLRFDLFRERYGTSPVDAYPETFELLADLDLALVNGDELRLTPKGRLLVEEIACLFEPRDHHQTDAGSQTRTADRKLLRHNFAPTYSARTG